MCTDTNESEGWSFPLNVLPLHFRQLSLFSDRGCCVLFQVSVKGQPSVVSLLQMASYSGLCVLVRLLPFRGGQQRLPLGLIEVLRDPHVLKVGVSCYEDGKRLMRDYGLALTCTVDLRYLALRQRCGVVVLSVQVGRYSCGLKNDCFLFCLHVFQASYSE